MILKFTVPGPPKALGRGRHGQYKQVYTTREDIAYQQEVWACALKAGARQMCFGSRPLWLGIRVFVKKPKHPSHPWPTTRPDLDNYLKQVMDALRPSYSDDAQIVGLLHADKFYGDPRLEIELTDACPLKGEF